MKAVTLLLKELHRTPTNEREEHRLSQFFALVSDLLCKNSPQDLISRQGTDPTILDNALQMIRGLEHVMGSTPVALVLSRLSAVETGLLPWLHDSMEALSDDQYNNFVRDNLPHCKMTQLRYSP